MIAYAKANPGKMTVATNGEGGFPHVVMEHLRLMAGFTYNYIPATRVRPRSGLT